ncbi:MAG: two-component regulator propeller domain-containing protein [Planctomycetota bacterium]
MGTWGGRRAGRWLAGLVMAVGGLPAVAGGLLDATGRFAIQHWTVEDGLPDAPLTGVAIAGDGSVAVASRTTLARFDGVAFTPLDPPLVAALHARIGSFWNIGFDPAGRLWVQGARAIARLVDEAAGNASGWRVHEPANGTIMSLAFTPDGRPLVVGRNTVFVLDGTALRELPIDAPQGAGWRYGGVDQATGTLWLWGGDEASRSLLCGPLATADGETVVMELAEPGMAARLVSMAFGAAGPVALLQDAALARGDGGWRPVVKLPDTERRDSGKIAAAGDGTLWISSHNGLLAARDGELDRPTARLPAFSYFTRGLVADPQGGAWAACNSGLVAIRRTRVQAERIGECRAVLERADGSLLVGLPGAVRELPAEGPGSGAEAGRLLATLPDSAVPTALVEDGEGRLWVGTRDSFLLRIEQGAVTRVTGPDAYDRELRSIQALAVDGAGRIWAATGNGLAVQSDGATDSFRFIPGFSGRDSPFVIGLAADDAGGVIVASAATGVIRLTADGKPTPILPAADLPGRRETVLFRDSEGTLWVGGDRGLVRIAVDGSAFRMTPAAGLVDDAVVQLIEDRHGRLWVAGRNGSLQAIRLADLAALAAGRTSVVRGTVLGALDGLGDDECIGRLFRSVAKPATRIVVPLATGLVRFAPEAVADREPARLPPVVRRSHDGLFEYAAQGLAWGERPLFQTMLAGVDRGWSPPSAETRRDYATLPPGNHEFRVRLVAGETDHDFPLARLAVTVAAPWWRSPAAVMGLSALAAVAGWALSRGLARRRIAYLERQRELDRERARIARDIHDSLGAGLTRVALLSDLARRSERSTDVRERLDAIHRDARALTRSVDEIVWAVNPGNDTVGRFVSYVVHDVEQCARAGDLSLRLDVPDGLDDDPPLPAGVRHHVCLAVRELLQNVLRHAQATHVDFSITVDDRWLTVTVADDGVGFEGDGDPTIGQDGIANVRARVAEAGGQVTFEAGARAGTQVVIRVPLDGQGSREALNGRMVHAT